MTDTLGTVALAWTIARRDGVTIGLTEHDRDLEIDGLVHRAAPGMTPAAVRRSGDLEADTTEIAGALSGAAIGATDLLAGRWDGARVRVRAVDWASGAVTAELGGGTIGTVEMAETGFTAELRGVAARLDRPVAEATSPGCRADLGDKRCRVAMAARRRFARVVASDGVTLTLDAAEPVANAYGDGLLRWFGGENGGLEGAVMRSAGASVTLRVPPRLPVAAGDLVELIEGCDRTIATCAGRFGNAANFRGEPYLPGVDLLTRYPGA
jgi:uncharacterized phage protein (TIGR02218 family)